MELPLIILEEDGSEKEVTTVITLQEVTRYLTGSKYVTASLEGKGTICFDHLKRSGTVIANTCNIVLTFPVLEKYFGSADLFIKSFFEDMRSDSGFGMV